MDFGRVDDLSKVDFSLPADDKITAQLFKELKKPKTKPEIYIGCAKWGRADWIGKIYPKGTKDKDFLSEYVNHFNCIELNAMFYRLLPKSTVKNWADKAPDGFKFCSKFTRVITHLKRLNGVGQQTDEFIDTVMAFEKKLGTSFIQLGENFSLNQYERVHEYLRALPRGFNVAIEFRHPDWFVESSIVADTYALMKELGVTSVITDTAGRRDVLNMKLTTPEAFIRYVGNSLHKSDFQRIDEWVERIGEWLDKGLQRLYFFIHQHDELYSPELSKYLIDQMNKKLKLDLKPPALLIDFKAPKH